MEHGCVIFAEGFHAPLWVNEQSIDLKEDFDWVIGFAELWEDELTWPVRRIQQK